MAERGREGDESLAGLHLCKYVSCELRQDSGCGLGGHWHRAEKVCETRLKEILSLPNFEKDSVEKTRNHSIRFVVV